MADLVHVDDILSDPELAASMDGRLVAAVAGAHERAVASHERQRIIFDGVLVDIDPHGGIEARVDTAARFRVWVAAAGELADHIGPRHIVDEDGSTLDLDDVRLELDAVTAEDGTAGADGELAAQDDAPPRWTPGGPELHWAAWSPAAADDSGLPTVGVGAVVTAWRCGDCGAVTDRRDDLIDSDSPEPGSPLRCGCGAFGPAEVHAVWCDGCETLILLRD